MNNPITEVFLIECIFEIKRTHAQKNVCMSIQSLNFNISVNVASITDLWNVCGHILTGIVTNLIKARNSH